MNATTTQRGEAYHTGYEARWIAEMQCKWPVMAERVITDRATGTTKTTVEEVGRFPTKAKAERFVGQTPTGESSKRYMDFFNWDVVTVRVWIELAK